MLTTSRASPSTPLAPWLEARARRSRRPWLASSLDNVMRCGANHGNTTSSYDEWLAAVRKWAKFWRKLKKNK